MKNVQKLSLALAMFALPLVTLAADVDTILGKVSEWLRLLFPIAVGVALLVFIWGMIQFIAKAGSEEERSAGRQRMIWGVVALFAIVSIWGLVGFVSETFDIRQDSAVDTQSLIPN